MQGLFGKTALVTGGSSGIGQAIATRLGNEGVNVAINYVGPLDGALATKSAIEAGLEACVREVNGCSQPSRAIVVEADVSDEAAVERMYKEVRAEFGSVDFLVNNAGIQIAQESDMLDATAFALCRDNELAIAVFELATPGNIQRVVCGEAIGTIVKNHQETRFANSEP